MVEATASAGDNALSVATSCDRVSLSVSVVSKRVVANLLDGCTTVPSLQAEGCWIETASRNLQAHLRRCWRQRAVCSRKDHVAQN